MTDYVVPPPQSGRVVSLTKGTDCRFTLHRKDGDGAPVDWDAAVYVWAEIDKSAPTRVDAVVTGPDAVLSIESAVADTIKDGAAWRAVMSVAGAPSFEKPLMVGYFERCDGGRPR